MADHDHPPLRAKAPFHHVLQDGELGPGATVGAGATARAMIPIYGLLRAQVRITTTSGTGTLNAKYVKPTTAGKFPDDGSSVHSTNLPTAATVAVAGTEYAVQIANLYGEAYLLLEYVDDGPGSTIESVVVSGL